MNPSARAAIAEFLGTAALLTAVVGSGIMAERLSPTNTGVALLANALATGFALYVLITLFGPVSGAHLNPAVTLARILRRDLPLRRAIPYWVAQWSGAIAGVWLAHLMFELPILQASGHARTGFAQWLSEVVATAGLIVTIAGVTRHAAAQTAVAVGAYIAAAYWFTGSTAFANPAVTTARALTDTFVGIRPSDTLPFIAAQLIGLFIGLGLARSVFGETLKE